MNRALKILRLIFSVTIVLIVGCKKEDNTATPVSNVKSFNLSTVDGAPTPDNGFIVYASEKFNLQTINNKIVKIGPTGNIEWQYAFIPNFTNDSNYTYVNVLAVDGTNNSYNSIIVQDSVIPWNKDSVLHKYSFQYIGFNSSGQKTIETTLNNINSIELKGSDLSNELFSGNILSLRNGEWLTGINISTAAAKLYELFKLSSTGSLISNSLYNAPYRFNKMAETGASNYILVGNNASVTLLNSDFTINKNARYRFPNSYINNYTNIVPAINDQYLITGYADVGIASAYQYNYSSTMIDQNIDTLWMKTFGTAKQDYCLSSIATNNNTFTLVGVTNYQRIPIEDYASSITLIQTDLMGNELSITELAGGLSSKGILINTSSDNTINVLGTKLAFGNPSIVHTVFITTKLE